jgi:hypothetical protein
MTTSRWVCYGCGQVVALRDEEPFRWFEITDYRKGEMQAVAAICDQFPKCSTEKPSDESEDQTTDES